MTKQTNMALAMIGVFSVAMGVQGGAGYAASNGINGMRKIPLMSLRQILPVDHSQCHFGLFCHFPVLLTDISQIAFKSMAIITKTRRPCNGVPSATVR